MGTVSPLPVRRAKAKPQQDPEELLELLVPEMLAAEREAGAIRTQVDNLRRQLADKRNVAFIRMERVIEEFGE